jgi:hypothetical protein
LAERNSNPLSLYLRYQFKPMLALLCLVVVPFFLIRPYQIPYMHFYFWGVLFAIKLLAFDDSIYEKNLQKALPAIIGNNSKDIIYGSTRMVVRMRNLNLIAAGLIILLIEIIN